jgi:hypothetical protein
MLHTPGSDSFLAGNPAKLAAGDALATFYTNCMLTQKYKQNIKLKLIHERSDTEGTDAPQTKQNIKKKEKP